MQRSPLQVASELLVLRAQAGHEDSLRLLIVHWSPILTRHAVRTLRNPDAAKDAVQEAWIAIASGIRRLDDPATFAPWALRIVHHKAVDLVRRESRHASAIRRSAERLPRTPQAISPDASDTALTDAVHQLDPDTRALLCLFYLERLAVSQLAIVFDVPPGTIKSRLFNARNKLKQAVSLQGQGDPS